MILADTIQTDPMGIGMLFAAFISVATVVLNKFATWLVNKKPAADFKGSIDALVADMASMKLELTTNGGKSMKDMLIQTHSEVKSQGSKIVGLEGSMENFRAQQRVRLEIQLNDSNEPTFICNEEGHTTFVNKALTLLWGMSKEDLLEYGWLKGIRTQEEKQRVLKSWQYSIKEKISYVDTYPIMNQISKTEYLVKALADPIYDDKGTLMFILGKVKFEQQ